MTAYAIVILHGVKDADSFAAYRDVAGEALAKHGGKLSHMANPAVRLEGSLQTPMTALLSFPSPEAAREWHSDPALADIHKRRTDGADLSIFLVDEAV